MINYARYGACQKAGTVRGGGICVKEEQVQPLQAADRFRHQGYLFSPAIDSDALIQRLSARKETLPDTVN